MLPINQILAHLSWVKSDGILCLMTWNIIMDWDTHSLSPICLWQSLFLSLFVTPPLLSYLSLSHTQFFLIFKVDIWRSQDRPVTLCLQYTSCVFIHVFIHIKKNALTVQKHGHLWRRQQVTESLIYHSPLPLSIIGTRKYKLGKICTKPWWDVRCNKHVASTTAYNRLNSQFEPFLNSPKRQMK